MSLFLFKPHVVGSEDNITTPDIVIDLVYVDGKVRSVNNLTSETYLQIDEGETSHPAFVLTALGGGALIGPAAVLSSGRVCLARKAWRLNNLDGQIAEITLNGTALSALRLPAELIEQAGGNDDTLPLGVQLICTLPDEGTTAVLADAKRGRELTHNMVVTAAASDRWVGKRPKPRYSVGPMMKEVQHFL
jgi:hypothetical protein